MKGDNIKLLDCTLRDGGQGLEIARRIGISDVNFTDEIIANSITHLVKSDIDIVELGYIDINDFVGHPFANHFTLEEVSKFLPKNRNPKQMYIALFTGPDLGENEIPEWNPNLVEGTRVILRYSELIRSLDYCEMLARKGYKLFVQPMLTMRYTDDDLKMVIDYANKMKAYALYFVDSFGYMYPKDIERLFKLYDNCLDPKIKIGFHAHNNLNLAFSNAQHFLKIAGDREIIIDSTVTGIGQGAGNLQTELILPYLNKNYGKNYNYDELLEVCEQIEPLLSPQDSSWFQRQADQHRLFPNIESVLYILGSNLLIPWCPWASAFVRSWSDRRQRGLLDLFWKLPPLLIWLLTLGSSLPSDYPDRIQPI